MLQADVTPRSARALPRVVDQSATHKRRGGAASKLNPRRATPKAPTPLRRDIPSELRALADSIERNPRLASTLIIVRAGEEDIRGMRVLGPRATVLETHGWLAMATQYLMGLGASAFVGSA